MRRRSFVRSIRPILPAVVVLPEPWRPTMRMGMGAGTLRLSGTAPSPPRLSTSTSLTILTTCWPGVTERSTSAPTARVADLGDEFLHHWQGHVGLEQGQAHFAHGFQHFGLAQRAAGRGGDRRSRRGGWRGFRTSRLPKQIAPLREHSRSGGLEEAASAPRSPVSQGRTGMRPRPATAPAARAGSEAAGQARPPRMNQVLPDRAPPLSARRCPRITDQAFVDKTTTAIRRLRRFC